MRKVVPGEADTVWHLGAGGGVPEAFESFIGLCLTLAQKTWN